MNAAEWATTLSGFIAAAAAVGAGVHWVLKRYMRVHVEDYLVELKPNGGASIHDKITKEVIPMLKELRTEQIAIGEKVAKLEGRFEQHVEEGE
jgi:hypothetical protein